MALLLASAAGSPGPESPKILVAAAADLEPLEAQLSELGAKTAGVQATFTFGASGMLARQIENGAPYDVYLSANQAFVNDLHRQGRLLPGSVRVYARGRLGLWSKTGRVRKLEDLLDARVLHVAIANPEHAPYGAAARQALERRGLWRKLTGKIVYGENVQQTFQFAATGNADACITSWSLVMRRGGILLPSEWHDPIVQAGGVAAGSGQKAAALRFMEALLSPAGRKLLADNGLSAP